MVYIFPKINSEQSRKPELIQTLDVVDSQPTPPQVATRAVAGLPADSLQQSIVHSDHLRQHRFSGPRPGLSGTAPAATAGTTTNHPELVVLLPQNSKLSLQTAHMMRHHVKLSAITPNHSAHATGIQLVRSCHPLVEVTEKEKTNYSSNKY